MLALSGYTAGFLADFEPRRVEDEKEAAVWEK
jgi:hypothetical protein